MMKTKPLDLRHANKRALRVAVYTRDRFTCQTCGWRPERIPENYDGRQTLGQYTPDSRELQLDHIQPRLHGGDHSPENLQTLCSRCNARKGAN